MIRLSDILLEETLDTMHLQTVHKEEYMIFDLLLKIKKMAMVYSSIATGDFFKLEPGDKVLHCLPSNFIAGKMMIVRAIVLGLELDMVEPSATPIIDYRKHYYFCAMTPMQLNNFLKHADHFKTIIITQHKVQ